MKSVGGGNTAVLESPRVRLLLLGFAATSFAAWLAHLWLRRDDPSAWQNDWYCFYTVGERLLDSAAADLYHGECTENRLWLYPPYMLYPYALLSFLSPAVAYGLVMVGVVFATGLGMKLLDAALPGRGVLGAIGPAVAASAAFLATLVTGQHAAWLMLGVAGALWGMKTDRRFLGGLFLGLLGIKPNWAVVFVAWLLLTRRWRELAGMALVGSVMILSTLPLGTDVWSAYLAAGPRGVADLLDPNAGTLRYPAHKLVTLEALSRSTVGLVSTAAGTLAWVALEVLAVAAALFVWFRSRDVGAQIAITVLVTVAANLYVEFYDGLVLAAPAAVWWAGRAESRRRDGHWKVIGVTAGALWVYYWIWAMSTPGPGWPALVGAFLAVWIGAEAVRGAR